MRPIAAALKRLTLAVIVTAFAAQSSAASAGAEPAMPGFEPAASPAPAPEIRFTDGAGRALTLADFRGKVVLLNLWATWCAPCVREMPTLDRLQAALGGPRFEVVALSLDRAGAEAITPFFAEHGITDLAIYVDRALRAPAALGARGLPTTVLIGPEGRVLGRMRGPAEWDSEAARALIRHHIERAAGG